MSDTDTKNLPRAEAGEAYWLRCIKCKCTTVPHVERKTAEEIGYGLGWRAIRMPGELFGAKVMCPECLKRPLSDLAWGTVVRPRYKLIGRFVPDGIHPNVDGLQCYWFYDKNNAGASYVMPVYRFWGLR